MANRTRTYLVYVTLVRDEFSSKPLPSLEEAEELIVAQMTGEDLDDHGLFTGAIDVHHAVGEPELGNRTTTTLTASAQRMLEEQDG